MEEIIWIEHVVRVGQNSSILTLTLELSIRVCVTFTSNDDTVCSAAAMTHK